MVNTRDKDSLVEKHVGFEAKMSRGLAHVAGACGEDTWICRPLPSLSLLLSAHFLTGFRIAEADVSEMYFKARVRHL